MKTTQKLVLGICALIVLALLAPRFILFAFFDKAPPPGQIVEVDGVSLHIYCKGPDSEVPIVIEAGAGAASPVYHWLVETLASTNRVCVWDRPGLGWSEADGIPDGEKVTSYLHAVLEEADVNRPVLMVGHSLGGLHIRIYQDKYPGEVAGLVFLDSTHPKILDKTGGTFEDEVARAKARGGVIQRIKAFLGITRLAGFTSETGLEQFFTPEVEKQLVYTGSRWNLYDNAINEAKGFERTSDRTAKTGHLGDLPVLVISAGVPVSQAALPPELDETERHEIWMEAQLDLASLSANSEHTTIENADHMGLVIMKDRAEEVAGHIMALVSRI